MPLLFSQVGSCGYLKGMVLDVLGLSLLYQAYIEPSGVERLVTKEFLDCHQVGPHLYVMGCERVPECMDAGSLDPRSIQVFADQVLILPHR